MSPCALGAAAYPPSLTLLAIANSVQLAEFCALVVPNIWAGSFARPPSFAVNTKRHATFTMFCQKVLKATQISCACVLLALYYIHQLRAAYPSIHASAGSEVRLFTTAIILANKFLDDNTFTNKTWSEVSSIPVQELNIMEMEFLSALNHNIYIDHQQFFAWVAQCQNWLPVTKSMRTIKMPAHLAIKPRATTPTTSSTTTTTPPALAASSSMPDIFHQHDNSTPAITTSTTTTYPRVTKRRTQEEPSPYQEPSGKRRYHVPYTPPDECIAYHHQQHRQHPIIIPVNNSCPQTPLYNTPQSQTDYSCRPVLSWSSSSSALASSRHVAPTTTVYSAASSVATAAAAAAAAAAAVNSGYPTSLLAAKVQCLRIE